MLHNKQHMAETREQCKCHASRANTMRHYSVTKGIGQEQGVLYRCDWVFQAHLSFLQPIYGRMLQPMDG